MTKKDLALLRYTFFSFPQIHSWMSDIYPIYLLMIVIDIKIYEEISFSYQS